MRYAFVLAYLFLTIPAAVAQSVPATFLDGTYVMTEEDCEKLQKLAAGGAPSLNTVPWSVDSEGFRSWEGGCDFSRITELKAGKEWYAEAKCMDAAEEYTAAYTFEKKSDGMFLVLLDGDEEPVTYLRCEIKKGQ